MCSGLSPPRYVLRQAPAMYRLKGNKYSHHYGAPTPWPNLLLIRSMYHVKPKFSKRRMNGMIRVGIGFPFGCKQLSVATGSQKMCHHVVLNHHGFACSGAAAHLPGSETARRACMAHGRSGRSGFERMETYPWLCFLSRCIYLTGPIFGGCIFLAHGSLL